MTGIHKDIYLQITSTTNKYTVADITDQYSRLPGDVNNDGEINVSDVTALISIILASDQHEVVDGTDVNEDGEMNISDVTALISIILAL